MKLGWALSSFAKVASCIMSKDLSNIELELTDTNTQKGFSRLQKKLTCYSDNHPSNKIVLKAISQLEM